MKNTTAPVREESKAERETMGSKPVLFRENTRTVLTDPSDEFGHKLLCDSLVFNMGDACAFSCKYCYCKSTAWRFTYDVVERYNARHRQSGGAEDGLRYDQVVIRRANALAVLESQLTRRDGRPKYRDPDDRRVVFSSTLVDVAANMELLKETAEACKLILEKTGWQIRLLSKSSLLAKLVDLIPERHHRRLIFGFSTGTIDDRVCRAIESGTASAAQRIKALHWLQDNGFRTFGMICPSLPQEDYAKFSREVCEAIRVERCEHVWAEPINIRGDALPRTLAGLLREGLSRESEHLERVHGPGTEAAWEEYARATFLAHARNIPPDKLRYLQYITLESAAWWASMREKGAVLLGKNAKNLGLCANAGRPG